MEEKSSPQARDIALARSEVYGLLARALSYPDAALAAALADGSFIEDLRAALAFLPEIPGEVRTALTVLEKAASMASLSDLENTYLVLFAPGHLPDASPYETAYLEGQIFRKMQEMADIAGFYRAFGLEPAGLERPDFIATELEFLHILAFQEARAYEVFQYEGASTCWEAQRSFLRDHVARWVPGFCTALAREDGSIYGAIGTIARAFVQYDASVLGVEPQPVGPAIIPPALTESDECATCLTMPDGEANHATI